MVTYDGTVLREGFDYQLWIYPDESIARFFPEGEYYGDEYSYPYSVVITGGDVPHEHTLIRIPASEPTCMMSGNAEYWQCSECGKICRRDPHDKKYCSNCGSRNMKES